MNAGQRPQRWGVIGTGGISHQVISDFALVEGAEVVAVCSRGADRGDAFGEQYGIPERYTDSALMLASGIDAVYIATPHITHFDLVATAIRAGVHVLCEKPLAMNAREVRELTALAADTGVFLMEAMWMKFNPLIARLAQVIEDGVLGEIRSVRATFGGAFPRDDSSRWKPGGSTLLDQGIYPITLAHMLLGRPETVTANGTARSDGVDLRGHFTLDYPGERFAQGAYSMVEWMDSSAQVSGTAASVTIGAGFWYASQLTIHHPLPRGRRDDEVIEVTREGNGYVPMIRAVTEAIRDGLTEHPAHTAAAVVDAFETMDAIRAQLRTEEASS